MPREKTLTPEQAAIAATKIAQEERDAGKLKSTFDRCVEFFTSKFSSDPGYYARGYSALLRANGKMPENQPSHGLQESAARRRSEHWHTQTCQCSALDQPCPETPRGAFGDNEKRRIELENRRWQSLEEWANSRGGTVQCDYEQAVRELGDDGMKEILMGVARSALDRNSVLVEQYSAKAVMNMTPVRTYLREEAMRRLRKEIETRQRMAEMEVF